MGQALYRKYRSASLDDVVGQEHITKTLQNSLTNNKISHAYLFTGPKGVGKTSVARILARAVNNITNESADTLLDVIEIDAASNRRIDEIRDLRDKVHILPSSLKYKVYIIDEVHMLTREAFNALLKTLEEPPSHVIFILATTEFHKLPETIVSRTQHFSFKPIDPLVARKHLRFIADKEKIVIDDDTLQLIAEHGAGSFRDSIGLLDQARNIGPKITKHDVESLLGLSDQSTISEIATAIQQGTPAQLLSLIQRTAEQGTSAASIAKQLGSYLREEVANGTAVDLSLLRSLLDVQASPQPDRLLEIVLLESLFQNGSVQTQEVAADTAAPVQIPSPEVKESTEATSVPKNAPPEKKTSGSAKATDLSNETWQAALETVKKKHNTLYGILRMAEPLFDGTTLTLQFRFAFHQKQLKDPKNQTVLKEIMKQTLQKDVSIVATILEKGTPSEAKKVPKAKSTAPSLESVSNIFGSAEVLES
ncbi:MAG TPA: DNA polymerase III subunit gamma/tau [Candidatus Saccharibacteria bacterium]|nr:DNA polymerase III subunit gamma/tau [Candidatus Saccharibacteria bacterium]